MGWDITRELAMKEARACSIPAEDAETMWVKYNELGAAVRAELMTDAEANNAFGKFCERLAVARHLRTIMSPNLDVLTGKMR